MRPPFPVRGRRARSRHPFLLCASVASGLALSCGGPPADTGSNITALELDPADPGPLPLGHTLAFTATAIRANGSRQEVPAGSELVWSSSSPAVATVVDGVVTPVTLGTTNIHAVLDDGAGAPVEATVPLLVTDAELTSIALVAASGTLPVGYALRCRALGQFSDGVERDITFDDGTAWTVSPDNLATVGDAGALEGQVRALAAGLVTITASSGGVLGMTNLTITSAVLVGVAVTPAAGGCEWLDDPSGASASLFTCATPVAVEVGATVTFTAMATFSDSTQLDVSDAVIWESSDASVLRVSNLEGSRGVGSALRLGPAVPLEGSLVEVTAVLDLVIGHTWAQVVNPRVLDAIYTFGATPTCADAVATVLAQLPERRQEWQRGCSFDAAPYDCVRAAADGFFTTFGDDLAAEPSCTVVPVGLTARAYAIGRYTDGVNLDDFEDLGATAVWNNPNPVIGDVSDDGTITGLVPGGLSVTCSAAPIIVSPTLQFEVTACPFDPGASFPDGQSGLLVVPANVVAAMFPAAGDERWLNELSPLLLTGTYVPSGLRARFAALARLEAFDGSNPECESFAEDTLRFAALGGGVLYDVGALTNWAVSNQDLAVVDANGNVTASAELEFGQSDEAPGFGSPGPTDPPYATGLSATFNDAALGASFESGLDLLIAPPCIDGVELTHSFEGVTGDLELPAGVPIELRAWMHLSNGATVEQTARDGVPALPDAPLGRDSLTTWSASDGACLAGIDGGGELFTYSAADPQHADFTAAYALTGPCPDISVTLTATAAVPSDDANPFATACRTSDLPRASAAIRVNGAVLSNLEVTPNAPVVPAGRRLQLVATGTFDDATVYDLTRASSWTVQNNVSTAAALAVGDQPADPLQGLIEAGPTQGSALITAVHDSSGVQGIDSVALTVGPGATTDVVVQLYQAALGPDQNCFERDTGDGLPAAGALPASLGWTAEAVFPVGFRTWARVWARNGEEPFTWFDATGFATLTVDDPEGTGTTVDVDGKVTAGTVPGTVQLLAEIDGVTSDPGAGGLLQLEAAALAQVTLNPGANTTLGDPQFGPDPIYVAIGLRAPSGVVGTFNTAFGPTYYCITSDAVLSMSSSQRARVDADGWITGGSTAGPVTLTATVGTSISDSLPVNVGPAELARVDIIPDGTMVLNTLTVAQLLAVAYFTDGAQLIITSNPQTTWVAMPPVQVSPTGQINVFNGTPGQVGSVQGCFTADMVDPTGAVVPQMGCSELTFVEVE